MTQKLVVPGVGSATIPEGCDWRAEGAPARCARQAPHEHENVPVRPGFGVGEIVIPKIALCAYHHVVMMTEHRVSLDWEQILRAMGLDPTREPRG